VQVAPQVGGEHAPGLVAVHRLAVAPDIGLQALDRLGVAQLAQGLAAHGAFGQVLGLGALQAPGVGQHPPGGGRLGEAARVGGVGGDHRGVGVGVVGALALLADDQQLVAELLQAGGV